MKTKFSKRTFTLVVVGTITGCTLAGFGIGSAVAQIPALLAPAGVTAAGGVASTPQPAPTYPVNSEGLTYGSSADSISPQADPDLVYVVASNGKTGYALKADLTAAEGPTNFKSPADALAWQASVSGVDSRVPVYDLEGVTVIGEFVIHHPTAAEITAVQPTPAP